MLVTYVGNRMLITSLICWLPILFIVKIFFNRNSHQHNNSATNFSLKYIQGESSDWKLVKSETFDDPFEKGNTDIFTFNGKIDLGELFVCRIEHDNSGLKSGWHLEHINVIQGDKNWLFPCNQVHFLLFLMPLRPLGFTCKIILPCL